LIEALSAHVNAWLAIVGFMDGAFACECNNYSNTAASFALPLK